MYSLEEKPLSINVVVGYLVHFRQSISLFMFQDTMVHLMKITITQITITQIMITQITIKQVTITQITQTTITKILIIKVGLCIFTNKNWLKPVRQLYWVYQDILPVNLYH